METALALTANAKSLIRILTDPITGVRIALDRTTYRPPADLARWVAYRDQRCRFPGCNRRASECDTDHAEEWQHGGVTNDDNLITLCRPSHVAKTMRLWQEELLTHGIVYWNPPGADTSKTHHQTQPTPRHDTSTPTNAPSEHAPHR